MLLISIHSLGPLGFSPVPTPLPDTVPLSPLSALPSPTQVPPSLPLPPVIISFTLLNGIAPSSLEPF